MSTSSVPASKITPRVLESARHMLRSGMTQADIARMLGVSRQELCRRLKEANNA